MPISPVPARSQPFSCKIPATSIPTSNAFTASFLVMAGSFKKSLVPQAILRSKIPVPVISAAIPTSTGRTSAPAQAAIRQTQDLLAAIFLATAAVTSCPVWVTPSATIPLSAHMITIHFLSRENSSRLFTPAMRQISSSNTPKLFNGFATRSQWAFADFTASLSIGFIPFNTVSGETVCFWFILLLPLSFHSVSVTGLYKPFPKTFQGRIIQMGKTCHYLIIYSDAGPAALSCWLFCLHFEFIFILGTFPVMEFMAFDGLACF